MVQVKLSEDIKKFIQKSTGNYGKAKLVLQRNKFFVESPYPEVLKILLKVTQAFTCSPLNTFILIMVSKYSPKRRWQRSQALVRPVILMLGGKVWVGRGP